MVLIARTTIAILILVVAGCAPTPPSPISKPRPTPEIPVPSTFADAEQAFENGQYPEALAAYNTFLKESYDDPLAVMALVKIGKIYRLTGRKEDALAVFSRIIREFPASDLAADASLEFLTLLFEGGDFEAVIDRGRAFTETTDPTLRRTPFFLLMADAQAAMGAYLEAAQYYYRAWNTASDTQIALAWSKLEETAELLSTEALEQLIAEVTDPEVMGLLLYRLGMAFILDEDYDQALDALQLFVERFPKHPDHQDASDMILSLVERARFTPFTVGCVLPLSGPYAIFGQRALNGIELALSRSGSAQDGIPFRVVVKDSRSDPGVAVEAVDELDQQKVGAILGPMATSESAAANADARGIPMLVFTQREGIPDMGAYVFRNFITPQMQARALVSFAVEELGVKRFAVLYPDENYGWTYMNLFWDQVVEYGGVVNAVEPYDPAGTDFAEPIKKMVGLYFDPPDDLSGIASPMRRPALPWFIPQPDASERELIADPVVQISGIPLDRETIDDIMRRNPARDDQWHPQVDFDAVFIPDAPKKAGLVIPQLPYYDIRDVYLLGTNLWNSETLLRMSGDYMKEALITDGFFSGSQSESIQAFISTFQNAYDELPGIIEALAYDSAMILFQAMRQTASDSRRDLKKALLQLDGFDGVTGRTAFAANGEAEKALQMLRIKRGRLVQVQRTPVVVEPPIEID